jgi:hypothetical protein
MHGQIGLFAQPMGVNASCGVSSAPAPGQNAFEDLACSDERLAQASKDDIALTCTMVTRMPKRLTWKH